MRGCIADHRKTKTAYQEGERNGRGNDIGAFDHQLQGCAIGAQHHVLATPGIDQDVLKTGQRRNENARLTRPWAHRERPGGKGRWP